MFYISPFVISKTWLLPKGNLFISKANGLGNFLKESFTKYCLLQESNNLPPTYSLVRLKTGVWMEIRELGAPGTTSSTPMQMKIDK